jgi:TonB family protein
LERYKDKKVVIIGGTSGMGLATAKMLLDAGARVVVTGRSKAGLESAQKELGKGAVVVSSDAVRHLEQYKRHPSEAQAHRVEGVVTLNFRVNRNGHVLAREIVRSSGHPELDKEVISMIKRAQPLPPFPPSMPQDQLNLTVPIRFSLR